MALSSAVPLAANVPGMLARMMTINCQYRFCGRTVTAAGKVRRPRLAGTGITSCHSRVGNRVTLDTLTRKISLVSSGEASAADAADPSGMDHRAADICPTTDNKACFAGQRPAVTGAVGLPTMAQQDVLGAACALKRETTAGIRMPARLRFAQAALRHAWGPLADGCGGMPGAGTAWRAAPY